MFSFRKDLYVLFCVITFSIVVSSCKFQTIDVYEKNYPIPKHEWNNTYRPQFKFNIEDTSVAYDIFIVLRHNDKYNWNNIWLELTTRIPGDTSIRRQKFELGLANNDGWLGVAMDDIYEQRVLIRPGEEGPLKKGEYEFTIGHVMREDPLQNIMNIGLRVEKKTASQAQR